MDRPIRRGSFSTSWAADSSGTAMVRDVYSGDDAQPRAPQAHVARYRVVADMDPGLVATIAQQLQFSNEAPHEFLMKVGPDGLAEIDATLVGVSAETTEFIRRKLDRMVIVRSVEVQWQRTDAP